MSSVSIPMKKTRRDLTASDAVFLPSVHIVAYRADSGACQQPGNGWHAPLVGR